MQSTRMPHQTGMMPQDSYMMHQYNGPMHQVSFLIHKMPLQSLATWSTLWCCHVDAWCSSAGLGHQHLYQ